MICFKHTNELYSKRRQEKNQIMRSSNFLISTLRETPNDAEIISHKLMLKAGLIRQVASGIYSWLPLGLRVLRKVEKIVREEMNLADAQELLMPGVQPTELWKESKRFDEYGPELLRFKDRHDRDFCLGPTHEEIITALVRSEIKSYKQLPSNFYQIQSKFRDEIRPRFGIMRAREFLMKDAYSFHLDNECLEKTYSTMFKTYSSIFDRIGLKYRSVLADTGNIGGSTSHEFHVLAESGEDSIAYNEDGSFAANLEMVPVVRPTQTVAFNKSANLKEIKTPNQHTMQEVSKFLGLPLSQGIKTLIVQGEKGLVALCLRGDHELNIIKAQNLPEIASPLRMASSSEIKKHLNCAPGSIGPVSLKIPLIIDYSAAIIENFYCGANRDGYHLTNVHWGNIQPTPEIADLRNAVAGDLSPNGKGKLSIQKGIEVGHIFQLGTKYSEAMGAKIINKEGKESPMVMGCYGIGVSRIVAAAIEQNHDANGIIWPHSLSPFSCAMVILKKKDNSTLEEKGLRIYDRLLENGIDTLLYDEDKRPGVIFSDIDLIGIPIRIVVTEHGLAEGLVEIKSRTKKEPFNIELEQLIEVVKKMISEPS